MGYYIETGTLKNKVNWILNHCQSSYIISRPESLAAGLVAANLVPVCVVDNGPFEAAVIAYNPEEAKAFNTDPVEDPRPRQWLLIRIEDAEKLNPNVVGKINWNNP